MTRSKSDAHRAIMMGRKQAAKKRKPMPQAARANPPKRFARQGTPGSSPQEPNVSSPHYDPNIHGEEDCI